LVFFAKVGAVGADNRWSTFAHLLFSMAGIQVSGLLSNAAFDWKSIVDQLIEAESVPIKTLTAESAKNTGKSTVLGTIKTALTDLQDSVQAMRRDNVFSMRAVRSSAASTTWTTSSASNAPVGSYAIAVSRLATRAQQVGANDVGGKLSASNDVSALTLANLNTATAVTAGSFSINGAQVTVATTDSLQDVFTAIATATGGDVTGSYNAATDKVSLVSASNAEVLLGSTVDSTNFLAVLKLANNASASATSSDKLGTVKLYTATLANSGLRTPVTGTGTFSLNGVSISYNAATDRVGDLLSRINASDAGITAAYDSGNDRFTLTNATTGDSGMTMTDSSGLLAALGLTTGSGGGFTHGLDAQFTVNGGSMLTSSSNTLGAAAHGIAGLTVVVNTATEQTLQVSSDSKAMGDYIADFMTKFNQVQDLIDEHTKITVTGAAVTTAVLAGNREVEAWARELRSLAFDQVSGLTGDVTRLDDLGIDFSSTTNHLTIKDADKLARVLGDSADDVQDFFLTANTGLVAKMYTRLTSVISADSSQQSNLGKGNISIDEQVARLQTRLAAQREQLTTAFMKMLDAQSAAQSQNKTLTNAFSPKSSNN